MKKILCTAILIAAVATNTIAQQAFTKEQTSAIVYFMPYTWGHVDITYTKTKQTPGIFKQYAQRYLGATKAFIENETTVFNIQHATIRTSTTADTTRAYTIDMVTNKVPTIALSQEGLLLSINKIVENDKAQHQTLAPNVYATQPTDIMPLLEEQLIANTEGRMAEGAARMIYTIRENRLNILAGEVTNAPADGKAITTILEELEKQEKALLALFLGTTTVDTLHTTYCFDPADIAANETLFRFSKHMGPVAADDLSGEPYNISIEKNTLQYLPTDEEDKPVKGLSPFYYNLPGNARIELTHNQQTIAEITTPVAQWGVSVPLPTYIVNTAAITFNPQTGAILSISK